MSEGQKKKVSSKKSKHFYGQAAGAIMKAVQSHFEELMQNAMEGEEEDEQKQVESENPEKKNEKKNEKKKKGEKRPNEEEEEEETGEKRTKEDKPFVCAGNVVAGTPCPLPPGDPRAVRVAATRWKKEGDAKARNYDTCKPCKKDIAASKKAHKKDKEGGEGEGEEEEQKE